MQNWQQLTKTVLPASQTDVYSAADGLPMAEATFSQISDAPSPRSFHLKDEVLDAIAEHANVAQFVSFDPGLRQRHCRMFGKQRNYVFDSPVVAVSQLLESSLEKRVNVRTFGFGDLRSSDFVTALSRPDEIVDTLARFSARGLYTIVNESIDVNDGGVSGVSFGGIVEFCPGDTPRCVEYADIASFPKPLALELLSRVYGFEPKLDYAPHKRIEFSIHPVKRGFARDNTIIWEIDEAEPHRLSNNIRWPNSFSRHLGDKLFGLILANVLGFAVPRTLALPRRLRPFEFGQATSTSTGMVWVRTCPATKAPGKYATVRGWTDPFALMQADDPSGDFVSSIIVQDGVEAHYSGAFLSSNCGQPLIEGIEGTGEELMLGTEGPGNLPVDIMRDVRMLHDKVNAVLGPVRVEWVHDGRCPWIVQLQQESASSTEDVIVPAEQKCTQYVEFSVKEGLPKLRELIEGLKGTGKGIVLTGNVGLTSHLADVLREARIPSKRVDIQQGESQMRMEFPT